MLNAQHSPHASEADQPLNPLPSLATRLVLWQRQHGRHDLPWQQTKDAYAIWVSEIMLQQTQVTTVIGYYTRFMARFPTVKALSDASVDEVLALWAGLGYYSRARNLHRAAQSIVIDRQGQWPTTAAEWQTLKGVGASTAAAIAAFAYGQAVPILDGNVKRILSRVYGVDMPHGVAYERSLWQYAEQTLIQTKEAGTLGMTAHEALVAYTQGVMDLGAMVCTRHAPQCVACPWQSDCRAHVLGMTNELPRRKTAAAIQTRIIHWWVYLHRGRVWMVQQPQKGIWARLWTFPEHAYHQEPEPIAAQYTINHRLTHRLLTIQVNVLTIGAEVIHEFSRHEGVWVSLLEVSSQDAGTYALPKPAQQVLLQLSEIIKQDCPH